MSDRPILHYWFITSCLYIYILYIYMLTSQKMSLRKATVFALSILKEVMEEKLTVRNVEVGHVLLGGGVAMFGK